MTGIYGHRRSLQPNALRNNNFARVILRISANTVVRWGQLWPRRVQFPGLHHLQKMLSRRQAFAHGLIADPLLSPSEKEGCGSTLVIPIVVTTGRWVITQGL